MGNKLVVCTGGEPFLQLDSDLAEALHTLRLSQSKERTKLRHLASIDCVSPKSNVTSADLGRRIEVGFSTLASIRKIHKLINAFPSIDGWPRQEDNTRLAKYCLEHPRWELRLQTHKDWAAIGKGLNKWITKSFDSKRLNVQ